MQGPPTNAPPMSPGAAAGLTSPPIKKLRADNQDMSSSPNANVASRRAQLAQLQKGLTNFSGSGAGIGAPPIAAGGSSLGTAMGTAAVPPLQRQPVGAAAAGGPPLGIGTGSAASSLTVASGPPPMASGAGGYSAFPAATSAASAPRPAIPGRHGPASVRHSDIFPSVPKTALAGTTSSSGIGSGIGSAVGSSSKSAAAAAPPPPPVARRLDDSFAKKDDKSTARPPSGAPPMMRPKSAPPRRPPPPPPVPKSAAEAPPAGSRHTVRRPPPVMAPPRAGGVGAAPTPPSAPPTQKQPVAAPRSAPLPAAAASKPPPAGPPTTTKAAGGPPTSKTMLDSSSSHSATSTAKTDGPPPTTPGPQQAKKSSGGVGFSDATPKVISPVSQPSIASRSPYYPGGAAGGESQTPGPKMSTAHAGQTPFPGKVRPKATSASAAASAADENTASNSRRDMVRSMWETADTPLPPTKKQEEQSLEPLTSGASQTNESPSNELRLQKELARSEKEKAGAFSKVTHLQDEVRVLKEKLSQTPGAKQHQPSVGFYSPVAMGAGPASIPGMTPPQRQRRVATPHPKRLSLDGTTNTNGSSYDNVDIELLKSAVGCCPHEFVHDQGDEGSVTFIIRRPFGEATEAKFWSSVGQAPAHSYEKKAHTREASTIEIAAQISHDRSTFFLYGPGNVRHQTRGPTSKWKDLGDALASDQLLGQCMYIDSEANEQEYSLDDILEQALCVRDNYCASVLSTAMGFKRQQETGAQPPPLSMQSPPQQGGPAVLSPLAEQQQQAAPKPETNDVCVGTEELEYKPPVQAQQQGAPGGALAQGEAAPAKPQQQPPIDDGSGDILSSFLGFFLSMFVGLFYSFFIQLPLAMFKTVIVLILSMIVVAWIGLYFQDDDAASAFSMNAYWNAPGIQ